MGKPNQTIGVDGMTIFGTCEILILDCDMGGVKGKCMSFWRLERDGSEVDRLSERVVVCVVL